jgi:hypothetical protein
VRIVGTFWHSLTQQSRIAKKAASLGLEPRQRDPESLVLPLHHEAKANQNVEQNLFGTQASQKQKIRNPNIEARNESES